MKPMGARCTTEWKTGVITQVMSSTNVKVDGISRHVRDIPLVNSRSFEEDENEEARVVHYQSVPSSSSSSESEDEQDTLFVPEPGEASSDSESIEESRIVRRRRRCRPTWQNDYVI